MQTTYLNDLTFNLSEMTYYVSKMSGMLPLLAFTMQMLQYMKPKKKHTTRTIKIY